MKGNKPKTEDPNRAAENGNPAKGPKDDKSHKISKAQSKIKKLKKVIDIGEENSASENEQSSKLDKISSL